MQILRLSIICFICFGVGILPSRAQGGGNGNKLGNMEGEVLRLQALVEELSGRVNKLDALDRRLLAYGRVDEQGLQKYVRPSLLASIDKPALRIEKMEMSTTRPGIFEFTFKPKLTFRPLVLVTCSDKWGDMPSINTIGQVSYSSDDGFVVRISRDNIPVNGGFSFYIFSSDGLSKD